MFGRTLCRTLCDNLRQTLTLGLVALLGMAWMPTAAWGESALLLSDQEPTRDAWSAVTLLVDPGHGMTLAQVREHQADFLPPSTPTANLGQRRESVWLHVPLQVASGDGQWVLDIDYPVLNRADVYLVSDGRQVLQARLGADQPFAQRPMQSRTHALPLLLAPGQRHELYLRVSTQSAMVLPITLSKPAAYQVREAGRQLTQGGLIGLSLALLTYSLAHWLSLRQALFGLYAGMLLGTTVFFLDFFGIAQQILGYERSGLAAKLSPLSVLFALAMGSQFVARALVTVRHSPNIHRALMALSMVSTGVFLVSIVGGLGYRPTQTAAIALGPLVPLLAIPAAIARTRAGDRAAVYMLLGWGVYLAGALNFVALLSGHLPATFFTLHVFQWATLVEMLAWVSVLGLHIEAVRRAAERTELEKLALVSLAHTDPLTSLPNRRGLKDAMDLGLPRCRANSALAVFMLDLDGFKPINDRLGHDAGDELLVQVSQRLRQQLRRDDVVARLGGDEFVILAAGLANDAEAMDLGHKLLDAFNQPFDLEGQECCVGLTIGLALAPQDGRDPRDLLKRADAAMYAGKQSGRHTLRRGHASAALVTTA